MSIKERIKGKAAVEIILIAAVLLVSMLIGVYLVKKRPQPKRKPKNFKAPAVSTYKAFRDDYKLKMSFYGKVRYLQEIELKPRVSGFVLKTADNFIPGGKIAKGDFLLQIDADDYKNALLKRIAEEKKAESDYINELGQQEIARIEWELANKDLSELSNELVLRKPSLRLYKAQFDAAKSNTFIAERDLADTKLKALFNMAIKDTYVSTGSFVSSQTTIATVVCSDAFIIEASLPWDNLRFLNNALQTESVNALVTPLEGVRARAFWKAELKAVNPSLEENGHLAKITLKISDQPKENEIPLLGGASVNVLLKDLIVRDVFVIPAAYVHEANQLWLMDEEKLKVYEGERIWGDDQVVLFADLPKNALIIKDELARVWPGMKLRDKNSLQQKRMAETGEILIDLKPENAPVGRRKS